MTYVFEGGRNDASSYKFGGRLFERSGRKRYSQKRSSLRKVRGEKKKTLKEKSGKENSASPKGGGGPSTSRGTIVGPRRYPCGRLTDA